jgi:hypothetical protein
MIRSLPDLWDGCYDGEHRKTMSPQQFRETFCANCLNAGCKNSTAAGSKWIQRMLTQEDRLLDNPLFADENDPQFRAIREQDFQDMVRQALAIEVSTRKGDWSVPTDAEIGAVAAEMVGMVPPPSGFKAKADPEEPQPPERLVDEVQEYDLGADEPPPVDEDGRRYLSDPSAWKVEVDPEMDEVVYAAIDTPEPPKPVLTVSEAGDYAHLGTDKVITSPLHTESKGLAGISSEVVREEMSHFQPEPPKPAERWRIRGDSGATYEVSLTEEGKWDCTCPSRENPCKHARDIAQKLAMAPKDIQEGQGTSQQREQPQRPTQPPPGPPSFVPRKLNTPQPTGGQMIGGGTAPPPAEVDPWAPPPAKPTEREIPVGGRVSFGSGKKKG